MNNCNDCGTVLKHLFGQKYYCPNDCDLVKQGANCVDDKKPKTHAPKEGYILDHITNTSRTNIDFQKRQVSGNLRYFHYNILTDEHTLIKGFYFYRCTIKGGGLFNNCTFDRCNMTNSHGYTHPSNKTIGKIV